jgi:hypothetical protein
MFFEGRTSHGGYSVKGGTRSRSAKNTKKSKAKRNSVKKTECEKAIRLADMFYEFVTNRLPDFKLIHNKNTGKSEKVPLPTSKKRMQREFQAMLESGEYDVGEIQFVLEWFTQGHTHDWNIRTVTSFWKYFPILQKKCSQTLNPYTSEEVSHIVQYLHNRFILDCDYDELESIVGRSLFAIEQVMDAITESGRGRELSCIHNTIGLPSDWIRSFFTEMTNSKFNVAIYSLTVDRVKKQIRSIMSRYGLQSDWIDSLNISMVRTYNRIRKERG